MVHVPRWQIILIAAVLTLGVIFVSPNLISRQSAESLPDWLPNQQINLGLDLRGGSYLLLEVDIDAVFAEQMENIADTVRVELRRARIGYVGLGTEDDSIVFTLRDPSKQDQAREVLQSLTADALLLIDDDGTASITLSDQAKIQRRNNVVAQSIEIVRLRIDETGTREPTIQRQGEDRILVQLPGVDDPERIKRLLGKTAKLTFRLVNHDVVPGVDPVPAGSELLISDDVDDNGNPRLEVVRKRVMVSGDNLTDAQATFQDGRPVVAFGFDAVGSQRFGKVTQENVRKRFAIVLDGRVISAPVIREPILGGRGIISGNFTVQEVQDLALLLRAGALPAPLTILEERTVGPGLGADSVRAGEIASLLGLIFVAVFMVAIYGLFGAMATLALFVNLVLIGAALSGLQATLTLPGIAGIVLTIGMAVDANVLIFERIREEARAGRGPVSAIDAGYKRALTTIIDSNLTTLIAAVLLFFFGSGPVKGFAVTLTIGLITSMFTAIMVTRFMVVFWLRRERRQSLPL